MRLFIFIIAALLLQEMALMNASLLAALQNGYSFYVLTALFVAAASFDIWAGYAAGRFVSRRYRNRSLVRWVRRGIWYAHELVGEQGEKAALVLLGLASFVYVNSFVLAWSGIPFRRIFIYTLAGDLLWYALQWLIVLGVRLFIPNPYVAIIAVLVLSLLLAVAAKIASKLWINRPRKAGSRALSPYSEIEPASRHI